MTWVSLDDRFPEHQKIAHLSDAAFRGFVEGLCYCARNLTDGIIPNPHAKRIATAKAQRELFASELWVQNGRGIVVHDYLEYQLSRSEVEAKREAKHEARSAAGRLGGLRSGEARRQAKGKQK